MNNECRTCDYWDSEYGTCGCPSIDKGYACPIESEAEEINDETELLTEEERADILNAINDTLEKFGLEVCGYEDLDGTFFNVQIWRR